MKARNLLLLAGAVLAFLVIVAVAVFIYWEYWPERQPAFSNGPKLVAALEAFLREQAASGRPAPPEVPLQDLVQRGYLTTNDVSTFEGMEVTFFTKFDATRPQTILARARTPDGQVLYLMADGSVQQFSGARYEEYRTGLEVGATNTSQPLPAKPESSP